MTRRRIDVITPAQQRATPPIYGPHERQPIQPVSPETIDWPRWRIHLQHRRYPQRVRCPDPRTPKRVEPIDHDVRSQGFGQLAHAATGHPL